MPNSLARKPSFWQRRRKGHSEDTPQFNTTESIDNGHHAVLDTSAPQSDFGDPTRSRKYSILRIVSWLKSWSRKKEIPSQEHHDEELASQASNPLENDGQQLQPHHNENSPLVTSPSQVHQCSFDGANNNSPSHGISFQELRPGPGILRHRSFRYLRGKSDEISPNTLKHSKSSPGFIRRKLSQHLQGTVVRRPSAKPRSSLAPVSMNVHTPTSQSRPSIPMFNQEIAVVPTLHTIEVTAAAKIYLESHFSQLLTFPSTRSIRRRKFEDELHRNVANEQERRFLREEWRMKETAYLRTLRGKSLNIGNYEIVKVIGKGAFGVVKLVRERGQHRASCDIGESSVSSIPHSNDDISSIPLDQQPDLPPSKPERPVVFSRPRQARVFALKVMQKADMLIGGQEGHLRAERDFLVASQGSKWIVPLVAAFQDKENLYLVMEYLIGGDFLALLIKKTVLDENETRFYVAEMICCIEEAHALGYIHRDVKPDNFLFTSQGHLKLCDFGLAFSGHRTHDGDYLDHQRHGLLEKIGLTVEGDSIDKKEGKRILQTLNENTTSQIPSHHTRESSERPSTWLRANRGLARSVVGTNQYMAPEVVRGDAYDGRCDWWSLGIIIYECLYGFTPFYSGNRTETRQKILNWRTTLTFPSEPRISSQAYHLVASLLCERQHRITSRTYAMNDVYCEDRNTLPENANNPSPREGLSRNGLNGNHGRHTSSINHVLPHDGMEIKSHPFFRGIKWHKLHAMKAPFIPEGLSGEDDTKYFDEESYDSSEMSTSHIDLSPQIGAPNAPMPAQADAVDPMPVMGVSTCPAGNKNEIKVPKRARDKLLRDVVHGPELLDLRKEVAFWGYTYRRPKTLDGNGAEVTGKRRVTLARCAGLTAHEPLDSRTAQIDGQVARDKKATPGAGEYSGTTIDAEELES